MDLLRSRDPQVILQQQLLWDEAQRRTEAQEQTSFYTPPLPSEPFPDAPPLPSDPAPQSPARSTFPATAFKYWPDKLPPPTTAPGLPGLYRTQDVPLPLFLWGLRFRSPEEALRDLGLPTDKWEEPPSKRQKCDSPGSSSSARPSVGQPSYQLPPSRPTELQDLLDAIPDSLLQKDPRPEPSSLSKETINSIIRFKPVLDAIKEHFPSASFPPLRQARPTMGFEETLRSGTREEVLSSAESSLLPPYKRLKEIQQALDQKIVDASSRGQGALSHLRACRPNFAVYKDPYFSSTAPLNEDFQKLVRHPRVSKSSISFPMEEILKIEKVLQGLQAVQSYGGWMLDVLSKEIKKTGFEPADPELFNAINKFLGGSIAESMTLSSSLFAFFRLRRREHFAKDFPSSLSDSQKKSLLSSPLSIERLFDNNLLLELAQLTSDEASKSANVEMARSLPKLTSAVVSASSSKRTQKQPFQQSSYRRDRKSSSFSRRGRNSSSSSRTDRDRASRSHGQPRGSSNRGRSSFRGSSRPHRSNSHDKPQSSKDHFAK